jgi:hypothetical protein
MNKRITRIETPNYANVLFVPFVVIRDIWFFIRVIRAFHS